MENNIKGNIYESSTGLVILCTENSKFFPEPHDPTVLKGVVVKSCGRHLVGDYKTTWVRSEFKLSKSKITL